MDNLNAKDVLSVFAQYGFAKTSMSNLADAAEVSRQSLYNHFGSKEAIFEFCTRAYVQALYEDATTVLQQPSENAIDAIVEAYCIWTGRSIPLLHGTAHGAELLDRAIQSHMQSSMDIEDVFSEKISEFIVKAALIEERGQHVQDVVFSLTMASKGLLLKSSTEDSFRDGMMRIAIALLAG